MGIDGQPVTCSTMHDPATLTLSAGAPERPMHQHGPLPGSAMVPVPAVANPAVPPPALPPPPPAVTPEQQGDTPMGAGAMDAFRGAASAAAAGAAAAAATADSRGRRAASMGKYDPRRPYAGGAADRARARGSPKPGRERRDDDPQKQWSRGTVAQAPASGGGQWTQQHPRGTSQQWGAWPGAPPAQHAPPPQPPPGWQGTYPGPSQQQARLMGQLARQAEWAPPQLQPGQYHPSFPPGSVPAPGLQQGVFPPPTGRRGGRRR